MKKVFLFVSFLAIIALPTLVLAQPPMNWGLGQFENETQLTNADLTVIIGRIVRTVLGFLGLIAVVLILIGGFMWMTSQGDEDKISKAKEIMKNGVIGLFIIVIAYAASLFIINIIVGIVQGA